MNGAELSAMDFERRKIVVPGANVCAHLPQWSDHAFHWPLLERGVSGNLGGEGLPAQNSAEQSDGRAGILGIQRAPTAFQSAQSSSRNFHRGLVHANIGAQGFHAA